MNKMMIVKPLLIGAVFGAAAIGCGATDGGNGSVGTGTQGGTGAPEKTLSVAERIVALNTKFDQDMHLVARQYLNNGTEVAEFYEPLPGRIMFWSAGSPLAHSVLKDDQTKGKSASELWAYVAPGEPVPEALAQAIERSKNPAPIPAMSSEAPIAENPASSEVGAQAPVVQAPAPAVQATGETLLSYNYCTAGFWTDHGNEGLGEAFRDSNILNEGFHGYNWNTNAAAFLVCPVGDVTNTGGALYMQFPNGTQPVWQAPPGAYVHGLWTAGITQHKTDCIHCTADCNPFPPFCSLCDSYYVPDTFFISGFYRADCGRGVGNSCGDKFDWISWHDDSTPWCGGAT